MASFPPSLLFYPADQPTEQPTLQPAPTPTLFLFGPIIKAGIDIKAAPVEIPLELQIPSLNVRARMLGVGLAADNLMDAPKGPIGDPVWSSAFWYRGGGIPGDPGTATIAGHVNDTNGRPEIFARLHELRAGDIIIVHNKLSNSDMRFTVNQVEVYPVQQTTDPAVLSYIYGIGPVTGTGPQTSVDGQSHLNLVTCAGNFANGEFDHRTVVYTTRSD
ncbi:MAG TPA: class F sortase [Anaerolineae bacterium]